MRPFWTGVLEGAGWRMREVALLLAFSAGAGLLVIFGMIAEDVLEREPMAFDARIMAMFGHGAGASGTIGSPQLQEFGRDVTALGSYAFLGFLTLVTLGYLLLVRRHRHALLTLVAVAGGVALSSALKAIFDRPRPDVHSSVRVFSASFPSGHAMLATVTFLTLASLLANVTPDRRIRLYFLCLAIFLSIAVGVSRVYLGVHYPSDVLAGWCAGGAWAILCWGAAHALARREGIG